jgi:hypothetical protein
MELAKFSYVRLAKFYIPSLDEKVKILEIAKKTINVVE